jgi:hypothetical protein
MSLHLAIKDERVILVMGFEDGRVEVWACDVSSLEKGWDGRISENEVWTKLWGGKKHNEAGALSALRVCEGQAEGV